MLDLPTTSWAGLIQVDSGWQYITGTIAVSLSLIVSRVQVVSHIVSLIAGPIVSVVFTVLRIDWTVVQGTMK
jgi:hypothetical protein